MNYDPEIRKKAQDHIRTHGLAPTHRRIVEMAGKNRSVLDIGCAWGYLAEAFAANECVVTGLEKDADIAELAHPFCSTLVVGDAGDPTVLRSTGGNFDVIVCADILEHLADPWTALRTMKELLAPHGDIIVSIPNIAYWQMRLHLLAGRFDYTDTGLLDRTHLRFFTLNSFRNMIRECGLQITERIINDAGVPGFRRPVDWNRLPAWLKRVVTWFPNMCVFHAIYRVKPERNS
jgi:2-polyprenyl-3-methyl-5-hydroxy-6-metoxy-1,4-benzoquinol methylase